MDRLPHPTPPLPHPTHAMPLAAQPSPALPRPDPARPIPALPTSPHPHKTKQALNLDDPPNVMAWSMGGMVTTAMATLHGDELGKVSR